MAQAPQVPNFSQYNFTLGDTQEAITKQNGQNAALIQFGNGLQGMLNEMGDEQQQTLHAASQIRLQTVQEVGDLKDAAEQAADNAETERQAAQQARTAAETARDDAERIAVGDVAVTELQQGAGQPGQILTATQDGLDWSNTLKRYDMPRGETTAALDLAAFNNFRINASAVRTLTLQNPPGSDRTMTVVLTLVGSHTPNWPSEWNGAWTGGAEPTVGGTRSRVVAYWDGDEWSATMVMRK